MLKSATGTYIEPDFIIMNVSNERYLKELCALIVKLGLHNGNLSVIEEIRSSISHGSGHHISTSVGTSQAIPLSEYYGDNSQYCA